MASGIIKAKYSNINSILFTQMQANNKDQCEITADFFAIYCSYHVSSVLFRMHLLRSSQGTLHASSSHFNSGQLYLYHGHGTRKQWIALTSEFISAICGATGSFVIY